MTLLKKLAWLPSSQRRIHFGRKKQRKIEANPKQLLKAKAKKESFCRQKAFRIGKKKEKLLKGLKIAFKHGEKHFLALSQS
jgi:hypothetical protein